MGRLERQLRDYLREGRYPFHMPGHKRRNVTGAALPYELDLTELPATDDLHAAEGILREAMARTAALYRVRRCWYLVNGSTCGNLAGIFAVTRQGGEILCARNCHRSVFHAIQLRGLRVHWLLPEYEEAFGIFGSILPVRVSELLRQYPGTEAVVLTSPTYEGVVSDIREIAARCHVAGVPLLVDEAHGAHFSLEGFLSREMPAETAEKNGEPRRFPGSAAELGADLVIQSPHKTLPSLTQTGWLHLCTERVEAKRVEEMLGIFESSSPSYPLLLSLDSCTELLLEEGSAYFRRWQKRLGEFYRKLRGLRHFRLLYPFFLREKGRAAGARAIFDCDASKILVNAGDSGWYGEELLRMLRERFSLELEMSAGSNVLAMSAMTDDREGYQRLAAALLALDREAEKRKREAGADDEQAERREAGEEPVRELLRTIGASLPESCLRLSEAAEKERRSVRLMEAAGRIAGEYVYLYPPGIPLLLPGERIRPVQLHYMEALRERSVTLHFSESGRDSRTISVLL